MVEYATVQLHVATKERLASFRRPGESYDAAVSRLLDETMRKMEEEFLAELDRLYEGPLEPLA